MLAKKACLSARRHDTAPTSSVLYFLHGDHLGSVSVTTCGAGCGTAGTVLARQLYDAWGNVRYIAGTMPTDVGFTGQRSNNEIGLLFYNARFYSAYLNRWLSPDSIVPDPKNPQSLNRYSYVNNRPLNFTDPTGHWVCDEDTGDCSARRWNRFGASADLTAGQLRAIYGIQLTVGAGQSWNAADVRNISEAVQQTAAALDYSTWKDGRPTVSNIAQFFKQIFGALGFNRSSDTGSNGAYAFTHQVNGNEVIEVYSNAPAGGFSFQNAAHEMGHAFAQRLGGQPYTDLANEEITYTDDRGQPFHVAGGGGRRTFYGMNPYPWVQDKATVASNGVDPTHEDFADMFLGWAYNNFAANPLSEARVGAARYNWMTTNMTEWIR